MSEKLLDLDALERTNLGKAVRPEDWMALLAYARRVEADRDAYAKHAKLVEHKVITGGVAARHPDANLSRTGMYGSKWNSPQAEEVRKLRDERDALRRELESASQPGGGEAAEKREADYALAYKHGWINCAKWADRVDLVSDIGSAAYDRDMATSAKRSGFAAPSAWNGGAEGDGNV